MADVAPQRFRRIAEALDVPFEDPRGAALASADKVAAFIAGFDVPHSLKAAGRQTRRDPRASPRRSQTRWRTRSDRPAAGHGQRDQGIAGRRLSVRHRRSTESRNCRGESDQAVRWTPIARRHSQAGRHSAGLRYFYFLDAAFGLIYLRVPTWAPFRLQFYCNGHNWLARRLTAEGIGYTMADNAFIRSHLQNLTDDVIFLANS